MKGRPASFSSLLLLNNYGQIMVSRSQTFDFRRFYTALSDQLEFYKSNRRDENIVFNIYSLLVEFLRKKRFQ